MLILVTGATGKVGRAFISRLKREMVMRRFKKLAREKATA